MSPRILFKRGDTFLIQGSVGEDVSTLGIRSQVRHGVKLVANLAVTKLGETAAGVWSYELRSDATHNWPVADLTMDIEYTLPSGQITSTETLVIECIKDETR